MERRASRRNAEVAQQVVRTRPAGVDVEELERLEMFSGDSDLNGRVSSMPWSQWNLTVQSYFGEFNQTATRLLQRVETNVEDPIIADNTTLTGAERRLSIQLYCVLVLTCRKRALEVVLQVPRGYGFEAWRQLCRKFGQHPPERPRGMLQALLSSTKSAELKRLVRQWRNTGKVCKEVGQRGVCDRQSARPTTRDRARQETAEFFRARQACAVSGNANATDLVSSGSREGDESAKPKEYFSWRKPGHSKGEYRYFSAAREKRLVQRDKANRRTGEDPEMGKTEFLGERGTSVLSIIPERDVCLFYEDDNDQSAYPCPPPLIDRSTDDLEDLMVLPCQAWFDTEAPEAFERDDLDTIATTEQHLRTLAHSEVRIESPRKISANSKFLNASVGTQKVAGEFALRHVTKLTDAIGQPTDEGREARPSEADEPVWSKKSAERIMRLLRSKRSFSELKDQKGEHVTPCDEQFCEQESGQARQMDRGEIEVEEERRVRAKRVPVIPTDKEKDESELMHKTRQCETEDSHKCSPQKIAGATSDYGSPIICDVCADSVSIQKIHSAVEACQVPHEVSETRAVNGVLENLVAGGLGGVLLKRNVGSAIGCSSTQRGSDEEKRRWQ